MNKKQALALLRRKRKPGRPTKALTAKLAQARKLVGKTKKIGGVGSKIKKIKKGKYSGKYVKFVKKGKNIFGVTAKGAKHWVGIVNKNPWTEESPTQLIGLEDCANCGTLVDPEDHILRSWKAEDGRITQTLIFCDRRCADRFTKSEESWSEKRNPAQAYCVDCQQILEADWDFCHHCGAGPETDSAVISCSNSRKNPVFTYADKTPPVHYQCSKCFRTGIKLWREYDLSSQTSYLLCTECACRDQEKPDTVDAQGFRQVPGGGLIDQIGWLVPAVPRQEDPLTYWGYTSVPQEGVQWWRNLPTRSLRNPRNPVFTYTDKTPPVHYQCSKCYRTGIKLWRGYNQANLLCAECSCQDQGKIDTVDEKGLRYDEFGGGRPTNQIGWFVPAVPCEEDPTTYWGYSSVPSKGFKWWENLPTRRSLRNPRNPSFSATILNPDWNENKEQEEEIDVEVEYSPGYFQRGSRRGHPDNWTPDEGEYPEIHSVVRTDTQENIISKLDRKSIKDLEEDAWRHQSDNVPEPDYDDRDD